MLVFERRGNELRKLAKSLVLEFMSSCPSCSPGGNGMRSASIFRECGLDWGDQKSASSSNQQYWLVALLRELELESKIERIVESGPWRLI